jgi:hypothetical protein
MWELTIFVVFVLMLLVNIWKTQSKNKTLSWRFRKLLKQNHLPQTHTACEIREWVKIVTQNRTLFPTWMCDRETDIGKIIEQSKHKIHEDDRSNEELAKVFTMWDDILLFKSFAVSSSTAPRFPIEGCLLHLSVRPWSMKKFVKWRSGWTHQGEKAARSISVALQSAVRQDVCIQLNDLWEEIKHNVRADGTLRFYLSEINIFPTPEIVLQVFAPEGKNPKVVNRPDKVMVTADLAELRSVVRSSACKVLNDGWESVFDISHFVLRKAPNGLTFRRAICWGDGKSVTRPLWQFNGDPYSHSASDLQHVIKTLNCLKREINEHSGTQSV